MLIWILEQSQFNLAIKITEASWALGIEKSDLEISHKKLVNTSLWFLGR